MVQQSVCRELRRSEADAERENHNVQRLPRMADQRRTCRYALPDPARRKDNQTSTRVLSATDKRPAPRGRVTWPPPSLKVAVRRSRQAANFGFSTSTSTT